MRTQSLAGLRYLKYTVRIWLFQQENSGVQINLYPPVRIIVRVAETPLDD
jgi:hypothetical protein